MQFSLLYYPTSICFQKPFPFLRTATTNTRKITDKTTVTTPVSKIRLPEIRKRSTDSANIGYKRGLN